MARIVLIDWNTTAATAGCAALQRAGHTVRLLVPKTSASLGTLLQSPPEAIVVDLTRRPSEGRNVGVWLRQRKATRRVPLVFVAGEAEKVERTRQLLPDATYTPWGRIRSALRTALRTPPPSPVVRGSMDAYSGTPLPRKLGIKPESQVLLMGAPRDFPSQLQPLPAGVSLRQRAPGQAPLVLLFAKSRADLQRRFPAAVRAVAVAGSLWILWRKKASGQATDLGEKEVRAFGLAHGFVDYKIAAIDSTWSGLRFARRRA